MDVFDRVLLITEEVHKSASPQCKNIIGVADAVNQAVAALMQPIHINAINLRFFHSRQVQLPVDCHDAFPCSDIDPSLSVLRDGTDFCRGKAVRQCPVLQTSAGHQQSAVVVGADPQALLAVGKQADDTGNSRCGIDMQETVPVISAQSTVAAYPDKAVARLGDGVCLGCRHAVCVVIEDSRISVGICHRVHKLT